MQTVYLTITMTLGKIKLISGGSIFSDMLQLTVNYKQIKVPKFSFILPQVTVVNDKNKNWSLPRKTGAASDKAP
jgi:hypothetical protein